MRILDFSDGFTSATEPNQGNLEANSLKTFASDAAFVTDKGSAASQGDLYSRTTDDVIRYHDGTSWVSLASLDAVNTLIAAHTGDTTDAHAASAITNTPSGNLAATNLQTAVNELQSDIDTRATSAALAAHEADTTSIHGITDTSLLVTTTGTQVLTAKDIDGGTASNTSRITIPKASKSTLDGLTRKEGTVVYASDTDKLYYDDGSILKLVGSGSGGETNFITDGDAEGANIFVAYADAAARLPVDGTGGSPSVTATISSSSPLAGTNSFVLTKGASNLQGNGIAATTITVDPAYRAKVMQIEFDYIVGSGTFVAGTTTTDSDVIVYIYDVTNSQLIEPSSIKLLSNSSTISDKFVANFQTSVTGSSYRLILHCATTSTAAYTLKVDNVKIKPCNYVYGTLISDWITYTSSNTQGFGTITSSNLRWRRVGQNMQIQGGFISGTVTGSTAQLGLPTGSTIGGISGVRNYAGELIRNGGSRVTIFAIQGVTYLTFGGGATSHGDVVGSSLLGSTEQVYLFVDNIPIEGWSSSVQMSDGYDGREIVFAAEGAASSSVGAATAVQYNSIVSDTVNGWDSSNKEWTVPSAGIYFIEASHLIITTTTASVNQYAGVVIQVDGVTKRQFYKYVENTGVVGWYVTTSYSGRLNAGQKIKILADTNITNPALATTNTQTYVKISKNQSPQTISATETIAVFVSGSTTTAAGGATTISWLTKELDTHGAFNSNEFIVPQAGIYEVHLGVRHDGAGHSINQVSLCYIQTDTGSGYATRRQGFKFVENTTVASFSSRTTYQAFFKAGDKIRAQHETTLSGPTISVNAADTNMTIKRVK